MPCQRGWEQQLSICLTLHLSRSSKMWHQQHNAQLLCGDASFKEGSCCLCVTASSYSPPNVSKTDSCLSETSLLCTSNFSPGLWFSLACICTSTSAALWHLVMVPWHVGQVRVERDEPCLDLPFTRQFFFPLVNEETTENPPTGE